MNLGLARICLSERLFFSEVNFSFPFFELIFASSICKLSLGATVQLVLAHRRKNSVAEAGNKKLLRLGMHFLKRLYGIKVSM